MPEYHEITVLPEGNKIQAEAGKTLLENIADHFDIRADCGGLGVCGKCRIIVETADVPDLTDVENDHLSPGLIASGYRLACQLIIDRPLTVRLSDAGQDRGHVEAKKVFSGPYPVNPAIDLPEEKRCLGLAVDLGTTTIAGYLCDLHKGNIVSSSATINPQRRYGDDVISRINMTGDGNDSLKKLQGLALDAISYLADTCLREVKGSRKDLYGITVAGNTTMEHILAGLDVSGLGRTPFRPATYSEINLLATDLGLDFMPETKFVILPIIAAFVGGDTLACVLADKPYTRDDITLIVDLGTNGELVLGNKNGMWTTSCATGPALEGAQLSCGMRATLGAISACSIDPDSYGFTYTTIGDNSSQPPLGFCGSGILDLVATMIRAGMVKSGGNFNKDIPGYTPDKKGGIAKMVLIPQEKNPAHVEIFASQHDIRQVQLAKAAVVTGVRFLMEKAGVKKIDRTILTGAFGNAFDWKSAVTIGMLPELELLGEVSSRDNLAGEGAVMALLDKETRKEAEKIKSKTQYMNLAEQPDFMERFVDNTGFSEARD
ncbi:ASKHA domain-containing protein [Thermodesulfobacteriota bacterium]